jgi:hypothetical protein
LPGKPFKVTGAIRLPAVFAKEDEGEGIGPHFCFAFIFFETNKGGLEEK